VAVSDVPVAPSQRPAAPPPAWGASAGQPPRRPAEPIRAEPPRAEAPPAERPKSDTARDVRKLIVGRDINLSGEITACDHLIVEGTVEARVRDCYRLEVAESGLFQGSVEIREADIAGRFLGELIVQGRLSVRATGKVEGKIQYGELAVDAGGTLDGEVRVNDKSPRLVADSESAKPAIETKAAEAPVAEASVEPPSLL
jgi:cytoskeletal protein CcmA (bactofilin family)